MSNIPAFRTSLYRNLEIYFLRKLLNIGRYTIVFLVHKSRKYLNFAHGCRVNLREFLQKLQNIGRYTIMLSGKNVEITWFRKSLYRKFGIFFSQKLRNIGRDSMVFLVQTSRRCKFKLLFPKTTNAGQYDLVQIIFFLAPL